MHLGLNSFLNYATYFLNDLGRFLKISLRLGFLIDRREGDNVNPIVVVINKIIRVKHLA